MMFTQEERTGLLSDTDFPEHTRKAVKGLQNCFDLNSVVNHNNIFEMVTVLYGHLFGINGVNGIYSRHNTVIVQLIKSVLFHKPLHALPNGVRNSFQCEIVCGCRIITGWFLLLFITQYVHCTFVEIWFK